jgi:hypothetical protein
VQFLCLPLTWQSSLVLALSGSGTLTP